MFPILQQAVRLAYTDENFGFKNYSTDAFTFLIPSFSMIFIFAYIDRNTKKLHQKIVSSIVEKVETSEESEGFLILLHGCEFKTEAFLVFDTSYTTVAKVCEIFEITIFNSVVLASFHDFWIFSHFDAIRTSRTSLQVLNDWY